MMTFEKSTLHLHKSDVWKHKSIYTKRRGQGVSDKNISPIFSINDGPVMLVVIQIKSIISLAEEDMIGPDARTDNIIAGQAIDPIVAGIILNEVDTRCSNDVSLK